jgi:para-aminobenzoate synthetase/4-amino-4-deoxychorismate lyase
VNVQPVRQALDFGERPDPALGIFETMLVEHGAVALLEAQLERLSASARELYGAAPDAGLAARVRAATPAGTARLRVAVMPGTGLRVEHGPCPPDPAYTEIAPFVLSGGLGPHKWLDRDLLDALTAAAGDNALPLLLDVDGSVLESRNAGGSSRRRATVAPGRASAVHACSTTRSRSTSTGSSLLTPWC